MHHPIICQRLIDLHVVVCLQLTSTNRELESAYERVSIAKRRLERELSLAQRRTTSTGTGGTTTSAASLIGAVPSVFGTAPPAVSISVSAGGATSIRTAPVSSAAAAGSSGLASPTNVLSPTAKVGNPTVVFDRSLSSSSLGGSAFGSTANAGSKLYLPPSATAPAPVPSAAAATSDQNQNPSKR